MMIRQNVVSALTHDKIFICNILILFLFNSYSIKISYLINDLYHSADECLPGTYRDADMSSCVSCDENSVSTAGASSCTACDAGTVANDDSTECGKWINPR